MRRSSTPNYQALVPKYGPNRLKYNISETVIDYAITQTDVHIILCNAYRSRAGRTKLFGTFRAHSFTTVLVDFDLPDEVLDARVAATTRSTDVLRSASSFAEVLARHRAESGKGDVIPPEVGEADFMFRLEHSQEVPSVIDQILELTS